jgi:hypothetical protein
MRQTAVEWLVEKLADLTFNYIAGFSTKQEYDALSNQVIEQAKEMQKQQLKDAYQHGRDDENCALSDGAMAPDYENADEWYQGEYGGEA